VGEDREVSQNYFKRPVEAGISASDKLNRAYINKLFPDTHVVTGQQIMPFKPNLRKEAEKIMNIMGNFIHPVLLSISMPSFLYTIVVEKEQKLI